MYYIIPRVDKRTNQIYKLKDFYLLSYLLFKCSVQTQSINANKNNNNKVIKTILLIKLYLFIHLSWNQHQVLALHQHPEIWGRIQGEEGTLNLQAIPD